MSKISLNQKKIFYFEKIQNFSFPKKKFFWFLSVFRIVGGLWGQNSLLRNLVISHGFPDNCVQSKSRCPSGSHRPPHSFPHNAFNCRPPKKPPNSLGSSGDWPQLCQIEYTKIPPCFRGNGAFRAPRRPLVKLVHVFTGCPITSGVSTRLRNGGHRAKAPEIGQIWDEGAGCIVQAQKAQHFFKVR